jgi:hypothetical protein
LKISRTIAFVTCFFGILSPPVLADPVTIDFENLTDLEVLTTQFPGFVFSNAVGLTSGLFGGSLNELENPPHSGLKVIADQSGAMSIQFLTPITAFNGFFTYKVPLTVSAFDGIGNLLGSTSSHFSSNQGISGSPGSSPNELIALSFTQGISRLAITGSVTGNSFTLDDQTVDTAIPEPATLSLLLAGGLAGLFMRRLRRATPSA